MLLFIKHRVRFDPLWFLTKASFASFQGWILVSTFPQSTSITEKCPRYSVYILRMSKVTWPSLDMQDDTVYTLLSGRPSEIWYLPYSLPPVFFVIREFKTKWAYLCNGFTSVTPFNQWVHFSVQGLVYSNNTRLCNIILLIHGRFKAATLIFKVICQYFYSFLKSC